MNVRISGGNVMGASQRAPARGRRSRALVLESSPPLRVVGPDDESSFASTIRRICDRKPANFVEERNIAKEKIETLRSIREDAVAFITKTKQRLLSREIDTLAAKAERKKAETLISLVSSLETLFSVAEGREDGNALARIGLAASVIEIDVEGSHLLRPEKYGLGEIGILQAGAMKRKAEITYKQVMNELGDIPKQLGVQIPPF